MHHRTSFEGVDVYEVVGKVIEEVLDAYHRISLTLEGKEPYAELWREHAMGYLTFHKSSQRYKLQDLGLGEIRA